MTTGPGTKIPMPQLPEPPEALELVRSRVASIPRGVTRGQDPAREAEELAIRTLARSIEGRHGWNANLLGTTIMESGNFLTPYFIMDILIPLCDWWLQMAREAVENCPAPDEVRLPHVGRDGRTRMVNTIQEGYSRWDTLLVDGHYIGNLHLPMTLTFEGQASANNIIWPFAPPALIDPMVESIQAALGIRKTRGRTDRQPRQPVMWAARDVNGRKNWRGRRLLEDWSGRTPEERNLWEKPAPRPPAQWNHRPRISGNNICRGGPECLPPGANPNRAPACGALWEKFSASLLEAFTNANPQVQFGSPRYKCLRNIRESRHDCDTSTAACMKRRWPADHDQICRFPDGEQFVIGHTYCGDDLCPSCLATVEKCRQVDSEISWRTGGKDRSWYFPMSANIIVIGPAPTIRRLDLDYDPPKEGAPTDCMRWMEDV